jgi:copper transport protein
VRPVSWLARGLVVLAALATPAAALAHAEPEDLERTAEGVRLVLSAPVEQTFLRLEVLDAGGRVLSGPARRDPRDPRAIVAELPPDAGPLDVRWRVFSQDGHPGGGGGPEVHPDDGPFPVAARLLTLVGPVGLLGLVVLAVAIAAPALRAGGVAPPGRPRDDAPAWRSRAGEALDAAAPRWWRAVWGLAAAWALGLVLLPAALLWSLREGPGELWTLLVDTRWGIAWWVQAAGLILLVSAAVGYRRVTRGRIPGCVPWGLALGLGPAAALVALSWAGHASTGGDRTLNVVIDALHNGATAAWLGGLAGLLALLPAALRRLADPDRVRLAAGVVVRFSSLAVAAVSVLVLTGVYRALAEVSADELGDTGYGRALLVKLGILGLLLCIGGVNRFVLHPRLERAALELDPDDRGAASRLRVSVSAELALAGALMVAVAVLVSLPPPS